MLVVLVKILYQKMFLLVEGNAAVITNGQSELVVIFSYQHADFII